MEGSLVFFGLPDEEKRAIFEKISEESGIPPYAVEKDWWVTQVLAVIFDMEIGAHLVFKGGTSLSKAWRLIERFSEDIDLAVDRRFLGFDGELSKNQRSNLRKAAKRYITEGLHPALTKEFENRGFSGLRLQVEETKASDQDPNLIDVYYPYVIDSPGYIQPRVQ